MRLPAKIKTLLPILLIYFGQVQSFHSQTSDNDIFKAGADRPEIYLPMLKGKTVAVVTNQTGLLKNGEHIVDFLVEKDVKIAAIMAPEHGFRGTADAGEHVKNSTDAKTGIPVISLYGDNKKPRAEQLANVDAILFDIQDVGVRFYTYISTLAYVMEAAAENGKEVIVLDRPNPHDGYVDGPVLRTPWKSFVGLHPVPVVYGMTIGEYGRMVNGEKWLEGGISAKYTLVPMLNYHKNLRYELSGKPSPNLPNATAVNLYPSLCFLEGTQVSVGRGTEFPFQVYGSPSLRHYRFSFVPKPTEGAKNPFLNGQKCYGEDLRNYPDDLRSLNLAWLISAYKNYRDKDQDFFTKNLWFDKLAGTDELRKQIIAGKSEKEIRESWQPALENFRKIRAQYIIYPD